MDTLSVKVFKMPDLTGDYQVDLTGQISLPLIGNVKAVDLTTAELDEQAYRTVRREISPEPGRQRWRQVLHTRKHHR